MTDLIYRLRHPALSWTEAFGSTLDKKEAIDDMSEAAAEIERLQEAKRRALAIADERSKENVRLRKALEQIRDDMLCDPKDVAENALNAVVGEPRS